MQSSLLVSQAYPVTGRTLSGTPGKRSKAEMAKLSKKQKRKDAVLLHVRHKQQLLDGLLERLSYNEIFYSLLGTLLNRYHVKGMADALENPKFARRHIAFMRGRYYN
jgi:hypothetical protein